MIDAAPGLKSWRAGGGGGGGGLRYLFPTPGLGIQRGRGLGVNLHPQTPKPPSKTFFGSKRGGGVFEHTPPPPCVRAYRPNINLWICQGHRHLPESLARNSSYSIPVLVRATLFPSYFSSILGQIDKQDYELWITVHDRRQEYD